MNEPTRDNSAAELAPSPTRRASFWRRAVTGVVLFLAAYLIVAYLVLPLAWIRYAHRHPGLEHIPGITYTGDDHPGDPINVALIGSEADLDRIIQAAGWKPADPLGLKSDVKIAADTVLERPYADAPVSNLFLWGRKQDRAFEQPVGDDPRRRHHVRFWKSAKVDDAGRPAWVGSATFDERVGLSHTTGEVTHHIAGDVDTERDHLFSTLQATGELAQVQAIDDFHQVRTGVNGGGDPWHTDGRLLVGTISLKTKPIPVTLPAVPNSPSGRD